MGIAITDDHLELSRVAHGFVTRSRARAAARARLETAHVEIPPFWPEIVELGWLGLHVPERFGGSGYSLSELVVVVEALGAAVAPGPFLPTVTVAAVLTACGSDEQRARWLPGLVDGTCTGAIGLDGGVVLGGAEADLLLLVVDDDVVVVDAASSAVELEQLPDIDPSRRSAMARTHGTPLGVLVGAARRARALSLALLAAEAAGGASECCRQGTAYAKVRLQFGRPIGTYQAVKHHCANMLVAAELAVAAAWDAARAAEGDDLEQVELAAAIAATLAGPAFLENAHLDTQVHGGIGYTWEHDAHLLLRRAIAVAAVIEGLAPTEQVLASTTRGVERPLELDLGPKAEEHRARIREVARELACLEPAAARERLIETGYVMPHWPRPWGRGASPIEQLVIEEEFRLAQVRRPDYRVAAWVIPSLVQHGTPDQVERWVLPALRQEQLWCQLFSEPEAGSDAAGIRTRGVRVDGGWRVDGQKVWTSDSADAHLGLATVRTDPDAPKHRGITTMVIDMRADGVEVRPLRQVDGEADFSEVFLTGVFVPDDDVVGVVDGGWTVARSTLGNERVSIGSGAGDGLGVTWDWVGLLDQHPERAAASGREVAEVLAIDRALALLNLRQAARAVAGGEPGPEANITKLVAAEQSHRRGFVALRLVGAAAAFTEGTGAGAALTNLRTRAMSIAGGTSEITRNQIGERLLGLPRDPLLA